MPRTITCQTITIDLTSEGGLHNRFVLPAYTRDPVEFDRLMEKTSLEYMNGQLANGTQSSTADFILYLITMAAREPRTMTAPDDTEATDGDTD